MARAVRPSALFVVILWLIAAAVGGPLVGKLSALQKNDQNSFLPVSAESKRAAEQLAPFTAGSGLPYFVVVTRQDGLRPQDRTALKRYVDTLADQPLPDTDRQLRSLLTGPSRGATPSKDGQAALVLVTVDADRAAQKVGDTAGSAAVAAALRSHAAAVLAPEGLTVQVTGPGGFVADLTNAFAGIDGLLLGVALGVVLVILLIVYRSPILPLVVLACAVFGLAAAALIVHPLAQRGTIQISGQSQGILSILVVGAATDYALLVVARYREELRRDESAWAAMKAAWRGTVEPIAASAATVVIALLCLSFAQLGSTRGLGPISALGILGALAGALTFLPAVLVLLGRRVFWPVIPQVDRPSPHVGSSSPEDRQTHSRMWDRVADLVARRARPLWVGVAALLVLAAAFAPTFPSDGLAQSQMFRHSVESVEGEKALRAHFPGGAGQPARIVVPAERATALVDAVKGLPGIESVSTSPAPGVPPTVVGGKVVVDAVLAAPAESAEARQAVRDLRTAVHRLDPAYDVGGVTATAVDSLAAGERDLRVMIPTILGVVLVVLVVLLRSLTAPLLLVLANVLSFAATVGVGAVVFDRVFGFPGADPATVLYGFVFLIALGIDYSIFLMTRVREETPRLGTRAATVVGLSVTGGVITSAGVVLAATFSALFVLPLVFMAQIAFLVAFGVLLDTFVVRSLLVPGLVHDIGERTWWPSKPRRPAREITFP